MKWLDVLDADTIETVYVCGYECSNCGYLATRKWTQCPHCKEKEDDRSETCPSCGAAMRWIPPDMMFFDSGGYICPKCKYKRLEGESE